MSRRALLIASSPSITLTAAPRDAARRQFCVDACVTTVVAVVAAGSGAAPALAQNARSSDPGARYAGQASIAAFADEVSERRQLPARWLLGRLEQARRSDSVRRLIMPSPAGTAKNWRAYRDRFVEPQRIAAGLAFWRQHERWLDAAEARYGVPPEVVLGIIGIETYYGRIMGGFRIIDALATLSFDFPSGRSDRSAFFRSELEEFFVWSARSGVDPLEPLGSYAGAMGLPQFMPSSINRYAVDFDGDDRIDLVASAADVAGSVARYLAEFGWKAQMPTHFAATRPSAAEDFALLRENDIVPSFTAAQMAERGAALGDGARAHEGLLALVELENGSDAPTHVAGTTNFYAITRYNWSSYYAMAVIELAQALKSGRAAAR